jgi:arsenical pump membrane protein
VLIHPSAYTTNTEPWQAVLGAVAQTWPPFALVAGLLLIGFVAAGDGVFAWAGSRIAAFRGGPAVLFTGLLGLVALVTATLNLDTSVVFLTPLLLEAARCRGLDERPFLYGTVLMSNSASLLLPGSNLTNLLVLAGSPVSGGDYALRMLLPWIATVGVTWLVVWAAYRRFLRRNGRSQHQSVRMRGRLGAVAIVIAVGLVLLLRNPAVPVLGLGVGVAAWCLVGRRIEARRLLGAMNPVTLAALFAGAVLLGTLARSWGLPATLMSSANAWQSTALGASAAVALNNLPAALLLSSSPPAHPLFLLLGLDLGPNLAVTGALSAVLWMRVARRHGAMVSAVAYSRLGSAVAVLCLAAAAACLSIACCSAP